MDTKSKHTDFVGEVVRRYFRGRHDPYVEINVQRWLIDAGHAEQKMKALEEQWSELKADPGTSPRRAFDAVQAKIGRTTPKPVLRFRRIAMRAAAVIVPILVVAACMWVYMSRQTGSVETAWVEYTVPYGETAKLQLPDGSLLKINPGSTVSYPEKFQERSVKLTGEAFFDVASDPRKPFVVLTEYLTVRVVGTEFYIEADGGFDMETVAVAEGGVEVVTIGGSAHNLYAGDLLTLDKVREEVALGRIEPSEIAKKVGGLTFSDNTCTEIFGMVDRYFGIPFHYSGKCTNHQRYTLKFNNNETIEQVMTVLDNLISGFTYEIRNDGMYIKYQ